jgi:hypothetical protein
MIGAGSNRADESSPSSFASWAQNNRISRRWARFSSRGAADAYQVAIDRLENSSYRNALAEFKRDHLRHITELGDILSRMGRTPPKEGDMKPLLTKGKVVIAGLMGDEAILRAMRTNEADTSTAYERAVNFKGLQANTRDVLQNGLAGAAPLRVDFGAVEAPLTSARAAPAYPEPAQPHRGLDESAAFARRGRLGLLESRAEPGEMPGNDASQYSG